MDKRQQLFAIWYLIVILLFLVISQSFFIAPHVQQLDYSEFKALLRTGNIARVTLGNALCAGRIAHRGDRARSPAGQSGHDRENHREG